MRISLLMLLVPITRFLSSSKVSFKTSSAKKEHVSFATFGPLNRRHPFFSIRVTKTIWLATFSLTIARFNVKPVRRRPDTHRRSKGQRASRQGLSKAENIWLHKIITAHSSVQKRYTYAYPECVGHTRCRGMYFTAMTRLRPDVCIPCAYEMFPSDRRIQCNIRARGTNQQGCCGFTTQSYRREKLIGRAFLKW